MINNNKYNIKITKSKNNYPIQNIKNNFQYIDFMQQIEVLGKSNENYIIKNNNKRTNSKRFYSARKNNYNIKNDNKMNNKQRNISKKTPRKTLSNFKKEVKPKINNDNKDILSNKEMIKNKNIIVKDKYTKNKYYKDLIDNNLYDDISKNINKKINLINSNDKNFIGDIFNYTKKNDKKDTYIEKKEIIKNIQKNKQEKDKNKNLNNKIYMKMVFKMNEYNAKKKNELESNSKIDIDLFSELSFYESESNDIKKIFELSNNRIAVQKKDELKIYSYNTIKLLSIIKNDVSNDIFLELKNKDLVRRAGKNIEFYKLYGQKYELFQKIEEENYIYSICGLMNGNLVSCEDYSIKIYSNEKDEYKLILKYEIENKPIDIFEIESNKLVVIQKDYKILILDISKKQEKKLQKKINKNDDNNYKKTNGIVVCYITESISNYYLNYFKNEKYLFLNFKEYRSRKQEYNLNKGPDYDNYIYLYIGYIYNLTKEKYLKCEFGFNPQKIGIEILSHYNNDLFIGRKSKVKHWHNGHKEGYCLESNELKLYKYEDNTFKVYRDIILPFDIEDFIGITKLKNNKFIIYSSKEIILLNEIK